MFLTIAAAARSRLPADRILLLTDPGDDGSEHAEAQLIFSLSSWTEGQPGGTDYTTVVSTYTDAEDWFSFHEDLAAFEDRDRSMLERVWTRLHAAMPELGADVELIETATPQTFYETTRRRFGMIGRPTPAATENAMTKLFPNLWLVGDTVAESFGLDAVVQSAWHVAMQIIN
jgi:phytoene dehydrogenase-like protein